MLPPPPWGGLGWGQQTIAQRPHLKRRKPLQVATTLFDAQSRWGKPHPTTTPRNVGEKYGTTMYQQHRSPPPRPSPAAGFALQGRGQFGGKMDEQLSNHSPFYSLPRSEAQRGRVGEGVALWSVYLLFVQNPVYIHLSAPGVCKWMAGIRVLSHCGLFAAPGRTQTLFTL